ncbi:hypothetical protein GCM10022225_27600 [Plantactinospora mayteni]|uniref:Flavin reductase n=1 Tax=Plantactinospora mayteni TaxID=566021 RepID=A0ABQ4ETI7_9ACTN|nr:hypothetical protein [Plantactinospora mayteni]GIG97975.1 hypothetical protein Pma05_45480 [Plantactinospora mayteni]
MAITIKSGTPPGLAPIVALLPLRTPLAMPRLDRCRALPDAAPSGQELPVVSRRPYAGFRPHTPTRPLFRCRECGAPWPCQPARLVLLAMYQDDRHRLAVFLAGRLLAAIEDQPNRQPIDLAARFLGWLPPAPPTSDAFGSGARFPAEQRDYPE